MEQRQNPLEGGHFQAAHASEQAATQTPDRLTDQQLIHYHITEALRKDRPIDHATARCIAAQLHGGQASALYALTSSGALVDGLTGELESWRRDETPVEVEPWLDALDEYLGSRGDPNPIEGWHQLWPTPPERQDDEPDTGEEERPPFTTPTCTIGQHAVTANLEDESDERQELMWRISAGGVTTLGRMATIVDGNTTEDNTDDQANEPDGFPWTDAARWSPNSTHDELALDRLDTLFGEVPDEAIGSVEDIGWFGLLKHEDRPGGVVLSQNGYGFRYVWETESDEDLRDRWAGLQREYDAFTEATQAQSRESDESGHHPEIWVGSLSDYNHGRLHGVWMDATLDPDELRDAIQFMLRNGYVPGAEEWGIFDHSGFCGYQVSEWSSLDTVSLVARGIAEHGPAYAQWVEYVGDTSGELLDDERFRDHYEGTFDSLEDYVEYVLEETGFYSELDRALEVVPEDLRRHIEVDVEGIAEEWGQGLHVVEGEGGGVMVFSAYM